MTAIAVSSQLGGTERVLLDLATHAAVLNLDLRVVVPIDGPLVTHLQQIDIPTELVPAPSVLLQSSQQKGHLWKAGPAVTGLIEWSRRLEDHPFLQSGRVAYTTGFKGHLAVAMAHARPLVWHMHEFPPERTGAIWRTLGRWGPDALIVNSAAVGAAWDPSSGSGHAQHPDPGSANQRTTVVLNGVDLGLFTPRPRTQWIHDQLGIARHKRLIGMPAVLARWKGHIEVIEAFRSIQDEFPEIDLVFVGGSIYDTVAGRRYGEVLEERLREAGGRSSTVSDDALPHAESARIHLLPFQSEIERVYPEFDITIHYSLRSEPFGRVILEAMASGVPVVAADEGGPREILGESAEEIGWLAEPRNVQALAATLRGALAQPRDVIEAMGRRARLRATERFSSLRFAEEVSEVFHRVASAAR